MKRDGVGVIIGVALTAFLAVPSSAYAANATFFGPIVPAECHCDNQAVQGGSGSVTSAPDYGCVLQVIQNIINFGVTLATILFTIYLVITGFAFMTSGGSPQARSSARTRFLNVFVGLAVLLCSWLLVDFVMKTIYNDGQFGPWNAILAGTGNDHCIIVRQPTSITVGDVVTSVPVGTGGNNGTPGGSVVGGAGSTGLNASAASSYALSHALSRSSNQCAKYVRLALAAGGLTALNNNHPANAYQYAQTLPGLGFRQIYSGTYSSSAEGSIGGLQVGDVVVFQPVAGHSAGHIAIYTSGGWVSDYRQNTMSSNPSDYTGGSFAIFRP